jgi:hypothetical protein
MGFVPGGLGFFLGAGFLKGRGRVDVFGYLHSFTPFFSPTISQALPWYLIFLGLEGF